MMKHKRRSATRYVITDSHILIRYKRHFRISCGRKTSSCARSMAGRLKAFHRTRALRFVSTFLRVAWNDLVLRTPYQVLRPLFAVAHEALSAMNRTCYYRRNDHHPDG